MLDKVLFTGDPRYHLSFRLRSDQARELVFVDDLEFHTLELPKFCDTCHNASGFVDEQKWLYLLQNASTMDSQDLSAVPGEPVFHEALGVLEMISKSPEERDLYESRLKFWRDEQARMDAALSEGIEQGREQGIEQGREQGRELGIERGKILGRLQALSGLLGLPESDAWASMSKAELMLLEAELQQQVQERIAKPGQ